MDLFNIRGANNSRFVFKQDRLTFSFVVKSASKYLLRGALNRQGYEPESQECKNDQKLLCKTNAVQRYVIWKGDWYNFLCCQSSQVEPFHKINISFR